MSSYPLPNDEFSRFLFLSLSLYTYIPSVIDILCMYTLYRLSPTMRSNSLVHRVLDGCRLTGINESNLSYFYCEKCSAIFFSIIYLKLNII